MLVAAVLLGGVWGNTCPDDPELDLCATDESDVDGAVGTRTLLMPILLLAGALGGKNALLVLPFLGAPLAAEAGGAGGTTRGTCGAVKDMYKQQACCGKPEKALDYVVVPKKKSNLRNLSENVCKDKKPKAAGFKNKPCEVEGVVAALEQAGANVTRGYQGLMNVGDRDPIMEPYFKAGLCPVNVHWHLGTEHLSKGEYDDQGMGPENSAEEDEDGEIDSRRLAAKARLGHRCHKYDKTDAKFTTEYNWQHCQGMHVGETYEVHWPHSAAGACGTPHQYQTPFYDGVFCMDGIISTDPLNTFMKIGVQAQVYTIVNDESYYYPDMFRGMIVDGAFGEDMAYYTGSTTGTSRNNTVCSAYTPITWQVDRKCHLISASSFDKMCADMLNQADDMSSDVHAHGSRELVADKLAANNFKRM